MASWRDLDTRKQFRLWVGMIFGLVLGIVLTVSLVYARTILRRNDTYIRSVISQYRQTLLLESKKLKEFVDTIVYNPTVVAYLTEEDAYERYRYGQQVGTFLAYIKAGRNEVMDIHFLRPGEGSDTFYALSAMPADMARALFDSATPTILGAYPYRSTGHAEPEQTALMAGCAIYDPARPGSRRLCVGAVALALSAERWTRGLRKLMELEGISYLLLDGRGQPIAGELRCERAAWIERARASALGGRSDAFAGAGYAFWVEPLQEMPGSLIACVDNRVMLNDLWRATRIVAGACALLLFVMVLVYRWISRELAQPIDGLTRFIGGIRSVDFHGRVRPEGNRDVRTLAATVNNMLDQQERLTRDLVDVRTGLIASELANRRAEIKYLRSQINPHFLYNTLELIRSVAAVRGAPEICVAAKSLARILRYSIQHTDRIALEEELAVVEDYIAIQTLRFRERITVRVEVGPEVRAVRVPRMLLQPVVENAYVHGLEPRIEAGLLMIQAELLDDALRVVVVDNGAGMSSEQVERLNAQLRTPQWEEGDRHIGLANVAQRIHLMGAAGYGLTVRSELGRGTQVEMILPALPEPGSAVG